MSKTNTMNLGNKEFHKGGEQYALDFLMNGFFYFFAFIENPAKEKVEELLSTSVSDQIKSDLRRVNSDYRKHYKQMRKEVLCLE